MKTIVEKHLSSDADRIIGHLKCFNRVLGGGGINIYLTLNNTCL